MSGLVKDTRTKARRIAVRAVRKQLAAYALQSRPRVSRGWAKRLRAPIRVQASQRSGAPAPQGELSGERDGLGTEEALDQGG